jgi:hypothetical protein
MYDIVLIESYHVTKKGDLEITAIIENMGHQTVQQTYWDPPEFAPARCYTVIHKECMDDYIEFEGKTQDELEELVNRYNLLINQDWTVITDYDDRDVDDYVESRYY